MSDCSSSNEAAKTAVGTNCQLVTVLMWFVIAWTSPLWTGSAIADAIGDADITLQTTLSAQKVHVAEVIKLSIEVRAPKQASVSPPQPAETIGVFRLDRPQWIGPLPLDENSDLRLWRYNIELETIRVGAQTIEPLEFTYRLGEDLTEHRVASDPIPIEVVSLLDDDVDLFRQREPKELVAVSPADQPSSRLWVGAAITLACLLGAFWYATRGRSLAPYPQAMAEISEIEQTEAKDSDTVARLLSVFRRFLQAVTGLPATSLASGELLSQLAHCGWSQSSIAQVRELLQRADEARFAGAVVESAAENAPSSATWVDLARRAIDAVHAEVRNSNGAR